MSEELKTNFDTGLTPQEYFDRLKKLKNESSYGFLQSLQEHGEGLLRKYVATGQSRAAERVMFTLEVIQRERTLVEKGVTTFVYKDDIENYIEHVADKAVKLIELRNYIRDIPDEIAAVVQETKNLFDEFYVLFTDYTGKAEREVEKSRRSKDPILFGTFSTSATVANGRRNANRVLIDRFYYLGDWEDEYCDLTFDRMMEDFARKDQHPARRLFVPGTQEEIMQMANELISSDRGLLQPEQIALQGKPAKAPLFKRVKSALKVLGGQDGSTH